MNKITVNMTKEALFDFLLFHAYSKLGGFLVNVLGLAVAFMGIFLYVSGNTTGLGASCYLGASVLFLAYTSIQLKIRAKKQVQANPEYSQPESICRSTGRKKIDNAPAEENRKAVKDRHLAQKTLWKASFSERFYVQSVSITLCWKPFGIINYKMGKLKKIMSCIILQVMICFFYKIKFLTHIVLKVGK
ncbi:MAG: hypothetical protein HFH44_13930 [Lachnospiraceae bacterium]|nr:hypothetical protein [Lachnospiraceae bacterium]